MHSQGRVVLFGILLSASLLSHAATIDDQFELAKTKLLFHLRAGDFEQAQNLIQTETITFSPTTYKNEWRYWEAMVAARAGQSQEAIALFERLPDGVDARQRHEHANLLIQQADYEQALSLLAAVDDDEARYLKALSHTELGQPERALTLLQKHQPPYSNWTRAGLAVERWAYLQAVSAIQAGETVLAGLSVAWLQNNGDDTYQAEAQQLSLELDRRRDRSPWLSVTVSGAWDSNPTLTQDGEPDYRAGIQANAGTVVLEKLTLEYLGYMSQHLQTETADLFHNQLSADYEWQVGAWQLRPGYRFSLSYLDGEPWQSRHVLQVNGSLNRLSSFASIAGQETQTDERQWSVQGGAQYTLPQRWLFDGQLALAGIAQHRFSDTDTDVLTQVQADLQYDVKQASWRYTSGLTLGVLRDEQSSDFALGANLHVLKRLSAQWQAGVLLDMSNQPDLATDSRYQRVVVTAQIRWSL